MIFAVDSRAGRAGGEPRAVHRVLVERVRDPRPARPVLPPRRHARPLHATCRQGLAVILAFVGDQDDPQPGVRYHIADVASRCRSSRVDPVGVDRSPRWRSTHRRGRASDWRDEPAIAETVAPAVEHRRRSLGSARWRSSRTTSSGCGRRCRSSTSCSSTWPARAGSGATGSGCARSTPRRRRRSTSARRPGATSASGAIRRGDVFTFVAGDRARRLRRGRRAPRRQGRASQLDVHDAGESAGACATQAARRGDGLPPSSGTTSACSNDPGRPRRRGTTCAAAGSPATSRAQFQLGWAPDDWDALASGLGDRPAELLRDDRAGVHEPARPDAGRVPGARAVPDLLRQRRRGGRSAAGSCPGSSDPAKYKNSPETPIYAKSKTLYGLNWAKADIVGADQVVVCEGYTDVIGFHRAGVRAGRRHVRHGVHRGPRPADQALRQPGRAGVRRRRGRPGRGRALLRVGAEVPGRRCRWRRLPDGQGPGRAGPARPGRAAPPRSTDAVPFLGFRLQRVWAPARRARPRSGRGSPSGRWRSSTSTPIANVRKLYAGEVAAQTGLPVSDLVAIAERRAAQPGGGGQAAPTRRRVRENAEFVAIALLAAGLGRRSPSG